MSARLRLNTPWLENCMPGLRYFTFRMSNHSSLSNACYKSIVSTRKKTYLAKCKSMYLCGHATWCGACPHTEWGHARVFLNKR